MENDVKEDLEQARPKLELKKQKQELEKPTQEKEQEIKKKEERKYIYILLEIIKKEKKVHSFRNYYFFIHTLSYFK
ncbi:hypothetical protein KVK61_01650 [Helicobacter pylori]|nr:hypothetical protein KVK61_01650 [Helicobacter pylori]